MKKVNLQKKEKINKIKHIKIKTGYSDMPGGIFLVIDKYRHWITNPDLFTKLSLSYDDVQTHGKEAEGVPLASVRDYAAIRYLSGEGVEIGALHNPSKMPLKANVTYVDYITSDEARIRYPDIAEQIAKRTIVVDDGEKLEQFEDESLDFIVANHFLEHTRDPIGTIKVHLNKLKSGGILLYALPDKRYSFDVTRPVTPFEHLIIDHEHGYEVSNYHHYLEYVRYVDQVNDKKSIEAHAKLLIKMDNRIHFHVWDANAIRDMFYETSEYCDRSFVILEILEDNPEIVVILKKN